MRVSGVEAHIDIRSYRLPRLKISTAATSKESSSQSLIRATTELQKDKWSASFVAFLSLTTLLGVLTVFRKILGVPSQNKIAKSSDFAPARSKWRRLAQRRGNTWSLSRIKLCQLSFRKWIYLMNCRDSSSASDDPIILTDRHWSYSKWGANVGSAGCHVEARSKQGYKIVKGSWTVPCLNIAVG